MQLKCIHQIKGTIRLISGLHIGAGKDSVEIGGLDQPIIKHPVSKEPYIPGSSLKGKMRSMLECSVFMEHNDAIRKAVGEGQPCGCAQSGCPSCTIFGPHKASKNRDEKLGPTRLLVRDAVLCENNKKQFEHGNLPMEIKTENTINRLTGTADNPRPLERVPADVCFDFEIALKEYDCDGENKWLNWVLMGIKLIEQDALGGGGSRGCGQVKFEGLTLNGDELNTRMNGIKVLQPSKNNPAKAM